MFNIMGIAILVFYWPPSSLIILACLLLNLFASIMNESKKFLFFFESKPVYYIHCYWGPTVGNKIFMLVWIPLLVVMWVYVFAYGNSQPIISYLGWFLFCAFLFLQNALNSFESFTIEQAGVLINGQHFPWKQILDFKFQPNEKQNLTFLIDPQGKGFKNPFSIHIQVPEHDQKTISHLLSQHLSVTSKQT